MKSQGIPPETYQAYADQSPAARDARQRHGILAPPPDGASTLRRRRRTRSGPGSVVLDFRGVYPVAVMATSAAQQLRQRYTDLSDRFRSLWTFYQFLGGVYKHQKEGTLPVSCDFRELYRRLQDLVPTIGREEVGHVERELDIITSELTRVHHQLADLERQFPPSLLRRFFDHLKRQDEKILFALAKFYLLGEYGADALDKLDILFTRVAEVPLESGRVVPRDEEELRANFERLAEFGSVPSLASSEARPLVEAIRELRLEIQRCGDFDILLTSRVYDRFRELKRSLGAAALHPPLAVELVATNIEAKNRFKQLYQDEEVRILEDTNRVFEIERYLDKNPDLAHGELKRQIDVFRQSRARFDNGRREDNLKRDDILEMRQALHAVLEEFDGHRGGPEPPTRPAPARTSGATVTAPQRPVEAPAEPPAFYTGGSTVEPPSPTGEPVFDPSSEGFGDDSTDVFEPDEEVVEVARAEIEVDLVPPDPLLAEAMHKVLFALELVDAEIAPEAATRAREVLHLRLEPWEVSAYRQLTERRLTEGTMAWEMEHFQLVAAALRVKMEEEAAEIVRLSTGGGGPRLGDLLERSGQSLERARDVDGRFRWFIDDLLYRGRTERLEEMRRSHHRFLNAYSRLWLDHQANGGITPL